MSEDQQEDKVANKVEADDDFDEEEHAELDKQALAMKGKNKDGDEDDEEWKKKIYYGAACFLCLVFILLAIFLGLFLSEDDTTLARAVEINITESPTLSPMTDAPTSSPLEGVTETPTVIQESETPTAAPTVGTTSSPTVLGTLSPTAETTQSRLNCDDIFEESQGGNHGDGNFGDFDFDDEILCADTYGPDEDSPNRNPWAVAYGRRDCPEHDYNEGFDICDTVGARRCSIGELAAEVGQGTGCGGDREFIWSSTWCNTGAGETGVYMFDFGLRDSRESFFICETDLNATSITRCCGDYF